MKKFNSFSVKSPTEIIHHKSLPIGGHRTFRNPVTRYNEHH